MLENPSGSLFTSHEPGPRATLRCRARGSGFADTKRASRWTRGSITTVRGLVTRPVSLRGPVESALRGSSRFDEGEQIGVHLLLMRRCQTMRRARVDLDRRALDQPGRLLRLQTGLHAPQPELIQRALPDLDAGPVAALARPAHVLLHLRPL